MAEKFALTWNDYEQHLSMSLKSIRNETDLLDVTLVSDDLKKIKAHKLLLSLSSEFFKTILKETSSNPVLFLSGVNSTNLSYILDYIYCGEIRIYQDQLDSFLDCANKLQIQGLLANDQDSQDDQIKENNKDIKNFFNEYEDKANMENEIIPSKPEREVSQGANTVKSLTVTDNFELKEKIKSLYTRENGKYFCNTCGKTTTDMGNMRKHVEIHIDGLQYDCQLCDKTFRSRNSLNVHKSTSHKKDLF